MMDRHKNLITLYIRTSVGLTNTDPNNVNLHDDNKL